MMQIPIPKPVSGGLILSYKCNAECQHCMYACSPKWKSDWISEEDLYIILKQLSKTIEPSPYGKDHISLNHGLHLTGGEPFLNFDLLSRATEIATELRIPSLFVETNAFWATNDDTTRDKLLTLKNKGLKGILISVNPFYLEYVPFERTERAVRIGYEIFGNDAFVYQHEYLQKCLNAGIKDTLSFQDFLKIEKRDDFARNAEFFMTGRAPYRIKLPNIYPRYSADQLIQNPCSPPLFRNWHNHFDNYGNFMPGYCGGLSLGNCRNLDELTENGLDEDDYPILKCLAHDDMEGLLRFGTEYGYCEKTEGYFSKCHLCIDIRKYLSDKDTFTELEPKAFYQHLE